MEITQPEKQSLVEFDFSLRVFKLFMTLEVFSF